MKASLPLHRTFPAALAVALALAGCAIGPDYARPDVEVPAAYRVTPADVKATLDGAWWEQFGDPALTDLVREALAGNNDVRIAAARVDQYLGALGATRAQLFPQAGVSFDASRSRTSTETGLTTLPPGTDRTYDYYQGAFQASWEIDLWGKLRRATEASRADLLATESARRAVVLTLVTQVANSYVLLRSLDRQLEIALETVKARGESLRVMDLRFKGGVISQLELSQSQVDYQTALATIPTLRQQIAATENAIAVLAGRNPGPVSRGRDIDAIPDPAVPAGIPSELLQRRPDVQQAEQQLVAANARIGVARALYFPSLTLTGAYGSASNDLSRLFTGPTTLWAAAAGITAPVFNAGAIAGQVAQAEAAQQQALFGYRKTVQSAFADVDTALSASVRSRESREEVAKTVRALETYARLAQLRYDNGYTSYLEVTDAQSRLFNARLKYTESRQQVLTSIVGVYAAMGGGWIDVADKVAAPADAPTLEERQDSLPLF